MGIQLTFSILILTLISAQIPEITKFPEMREINAQELRYIYHTKPVPVGQTYLVLFHGFSNPKCEAMKVEVMKVAETW